MNFIHGVACVSSDLMIQRGNEVALSMEKKTDAKTLETHAEGIQPRISRV